jgi:GcrA cell cycle regulator
MALMNQIAAAPPTPNPSPAAMWPDDRVEALKRAWREGLSASQIAGRLGGGLTRSAVIGKLHRLGVSGGRKPSAPRVAFTPSTPPNQMARPDPAPIQLRWPIPILEAQPISPASGAPPCGPGPKYLRDMTPRECRFGLGDPGPGNGAFQLFCAAPTAGHPYCAHHRAIAVLPPRPLSEQKVIKLAAADVKTSGVRRRPGVTP